MEIALRRSGFAARPEQVLGLTRGLTLAALSWGALAFGGVYAWAYWPLAAACAAAGLINLACSVRSDQSFIPVPLTVALAFFAAAALVQLIPLPLPTLTAIGPANVATLHAYDPSFAAGLVTSHPLSIQPAATWTGVTLFAVFALLVLGTTGALSLGGTRRLVEGLTVLGVVLALVGIVQKPLSNGKIYGLWTPEMPGSANFGPFVNRNHFAGWMLMGLPLTLGLLFAAMSSGLRGVRPGWRHRMLWLSTPDASRLLIIGAAAGVMALSLVLTLSRSGIMAFALSLMLCAWFVIRTLRSRWLRAIVIVYLALMGLGVMAWAGTDVLMKRFSTTASEFGDRTGAWDDAASIVSAFPIAGTGLNTYGVATLFYQRHELTSHYEQAHNDYLQLAAEGGVLLVLPAVLVVLALIIEIRRRSRETQPGSTSHWLRAGAVTALVAVAFQEAVDFSLQMPANTALFAVVCAIAMHRAPAGRRVDDAR